MIDSLRQGKAAIGNLAWDWGWCGQSPVYEIEGYEYQGVDVDVVHCGSKLDMVFANGLLDE